MSGQIQSSAGLMRVKKVHDVQAQVPLQPFNVGVSAVKYLRTGESTYSAETSLDNYQLVF